MRYLIKFWLVVSIGGLFVFPLSAKGQPVLADQVRQGFYSVPDSVQTSVYWYWISDHLSKDGVIEDLKAMKKAGINRAFIGNIFIKEIPRGKVRIFSDEWWEILHTALKTAGDLGIEIGIFNSPGWSQSGGPWVKPTQSMRYLAAKDTVIEGPFEGKLLLPAATGDFTDVRVVAFKLPSDAETTLSNKYPVITSSVRGKEVKAVMDGDRETAVTLSGGDTTTTFVFSVKEAFTARSIAIYPELNKASKMTVTLEAGDGVVFKPVKSFEMDRINNRLNVGFEQFAPVIESFSEVTAKVFRVIFSNVTEGSGIGEISIQAAPKIARYKEKTLARMHPTPLAYWKDYLWPRQEEPLTGDMVIGREDVLDLTDQFNNVSGALSWKVPSGRWKILRTGMAPTKVTNHPASPQGIGLEVDKMSREHIMSHFEAFLGEMIRRIPAEDRKTWKVVVQDSYETGGQNWTDDFENKFCKAFGYSPIPFIPALYGFTVGSQDESDRFLWDLRRFVADCVAYEYVGGLRDISHKYGLTTWLENYGHWGFPGEFLQYGGQSDEISGEFWSEGELGDIENRAASSAAHIYGKTKVSAESFTASGKTFARYPAMFKQRGDKFFTEGINNTLLHVFIHQPYPNRKPGVNAWFGNEFNRFNTWYNDMDLFIDYLKRCNFVLQQGTYVADVAYFIGEDAPKMTGEQNPPLPKGYSFDYINAEVILKRLDVKDGKFILPDGLQYKVLVLPPLSSMRPELLAKIAELVKKGGVVVGSRPAYSPSLSNYKEADKKVKKLADELWGNMDGRQIKIHKLGKGSVMDGMTLEEVFRQLALYPDFQTNENDSVLYIHRTLPDAEIYFLSNQKDSVVHVNPVFRTDAKQVELWNAITGKTCALPEFSVSAGRTAVPLKLEAFESAFLVFSSQVKKDSLNKLRINYAKPVSRFTLDGAWQVKFDTAFSPGPKGPVQFHQLTDWSKHPDTAIAYFAGSAVYSKTVTINNFSDKAAYVLDLGRVVAVAKVEVNGKPLGGVWTAPYKVDISSAIKPGSNLITIKVTNTWANRLIGDQRVDQEKRSTWTLFNPYKPDSNLETGGLLGPVLIERYD